MRRPRRMKRPLNPCVGDYAFIDHILELHKKDCTVSADISHHFSTEFFFCLLNILIEQFDCFIFCFRCEILRKAFTTYCPIDLKFVTYAYSPSCLLLVLGLVNIYIKHRHIRLRYFIFVYSFL